MVILLTGVAGVGKTTVGQALAQELHWQFADADDFHSPENVAKMRSGVPLDDADRAPWLQALHEAIVQWIAEGKSAVLACSALKEAYRRQLVAGPEVKVVWLHAEYQVIERWLTERHGHYMNPALLRSQFETLEPPRDAVSIDTNKDIPAVVAAIRRGVGV
jgi:gluconokinase